MTGLPESSECQLTRNLPSSFPYCLKLEENAEVHFSKAWSKGLSKQAFWCSGLLFLVLCVNLPGPWGAQDIWST